MAENFPEIFKGYFSSKDNVNPFLGCLPDLENKNLKIADFGGGSGYLLDQVANFYQNKGCTVDCWLIDNNNEQVRNAPNKFKKINKNCLKFSKEKHFDIIIMRSVLQFFLNRQEKITVLNNISKSLKEKGTFINQALFFEKPDNKIVAQSYRYFNRSLNIETLEELIGLYNKSSFKNCKIEKFCPTMIVSDSDIKKRFMVNGAVIDKMRNLFNGNIKKSHFIEVVGKNFKINCNYVIVTSKK